MKKNAIRMLAILLVMMCLGTIAACAETVSLASASGSLNLRKGPGTEYDSVGILRHGDKITVVDEGSVWSKVKTESGKVGYIKNLYIKGSSSSSYGNSTTYFSKSYAAYVTANVNFRSGASTSTASMGTLTKGTKVTVLGENGSFYMIKNAAGAQGFVSKKYISTTKPTGGSASGSTSSGSTSTGGSSTGTTSGTKATVALAYKNGSLHIRKGAGTNYASVGTLRHGDSITVLSWGSVWSKIKTAGGTVGYIKNLYIKGGNSSYASGTSYFSKTYTLYTTANVNFRAGAGTNTASMGTLTKGTKLKALGENGGFYLVETAGGTQGYVSKKYVSKTKPAVTATAKPTAKPATKPAATVKPVATAKPEAVATPAPTFEIITANEVVIEPIVSIEPTEVVDEAAQLAIGRFTGKWQDSKSQRATAEIDYVDGQFVINIHWANSAEEAYEWRMTGELEKPGNNLVVSSDCVKVLVAADDKGEVTETVQYENGEAYFAIINGILYWYDDTESAGEQCIFEKMASAVNPEGYGLMNVTKVYADDVTLNICVEGTFGEMNEGGVVVGFEPEKTVNLILAPGSVVMLPADLMNPFVNSVCNTPVVWFEDAVANVPGYSFYAEVELNESDEIASLSYTYIP